VTVPGGDRHLGILPRRPRGQCGASVVAATLAVINRMEDSVKLTDTQLVLLSVASQREDRALERPSNLTGGAAGKVVAKLLTEDLVEEIQSRGSLPVARSRFGDATRMVHAPCGSPRRAFRPFRSRTKRRLRGSQRRSRPLHRRAGVSPPRHPPAHERAGRPSLRGLAPIPSRPT
jgi:hypothetical protein